MGSAAVTATGAGWVGDSARLMSMAWEQEVWADLGVGIAGGVGVRRVCGRRSDRRRWGALLGVVSQG